MHNQDENGFVNYLGTGCELLYLSPAPYGTLWHLGETSKLLLDK